MNCGPQPHRYGFKWRFLLTDQWQRGSASSFISPQCSAPLHRCVLICFSLFSSLYRCVPIICSNLSAWMCFYSSNHDKKKWEHFTIWGWSHECKAWMQCFYKMPFFRLCYCSLCICSTPPQIQHSWMLHVALRCHWINTMAFKVIHN